MAVMNLRKSIESLDVRLANGAAVVVILSVDKSAEINPALPDRLDLVDQLHGLRELLLEIKVQRQERGRHNPASGRAAGAAAALQRGDAYDHPEA
jgi:hypothetical protein